MQWITSKTLGEIINNVITKIKSFVELLQAVSYMHIYTSWDFWPLNLWNSNESEHYPSCAHLDEAFLSSQVLEECLACAQRQGSPSFPWQTWSECITYYRAQQVTYRRNTQSSVVNTQQTYKFSALRIESSEVHL